MSSTRVLFDVRYACANCATPWDSPVDSCTGCGMEKDRARIRWDESFHGPTAGADLD